MRALFVLTPAESKRLIGKGVAEMKEIKNALRNGKLHIQLGSTNVYVAEEILGKEKFNELFDRNKYLSGVLTKGVTCQTLVEEKPISLFIDRGEIQPPTPTMAEMLVQFDKNSVFVKGANALDREGNVAAFVGHPEGGAVGWAIGMLLAQGIQIISPVGLEKMVPSVKQSVELCGIQKLDYCSGMKLGMIPLTGARVITEIEALKILTGVDGFHVASGGHGGSEGSVSLIAEGDSAALEKAISLIESIKGEPPLMPRKAICETCDIRSAQQAKNTKVDHVVVHCQYKGQKEEQLPVFLRNR